MPKVVQDAITSADVEKRLRELANINKLHLDQWQLLENNVMLTLFGFQEPEELSKELQQDLEISEELAHNLANEVSKIVFEPIRQELERELEHPEAKTEEKNGVEAAREQVLAAKAQEALQITPATPPAPPPTTKAVRAPLSEGPASGAYKPGETSMERKSVHDDPYRELPT